MLGRLLGVGLICLAACYNAPEPDCGFICGPGGACPADYTCAGDRVCHRNGAPAGLVCPGPADAGVTVDGPPVAPHIVMHDPLSGETGVAVDKIVTMTLDQDVTGVENSSFYLMDDTGLLDSTAQFHSPSLLAECRPTLQLAPNKTYTAVVASGIANAAGVPLQPTQWMFTTGADTVAPHLAASVPFNGQTSVPVTTDIMLAFDEPVTGVDITSVTVTDGVTPVVGAITSTDTHSYDFTPSAALASATTYTVMLTNTIQDAYGNALAPTTFSFTTL